MRWSCMQSLFTQASHLSADFIFISFYILPLALSPNTSHHSEFNEITNRLILKTKRIYILKTKYS